MSSNATRPRTRGAQQSQLNDPNNMDHGARARKLDSPIAPTSVSQRTVLAATGLTPAKYLEIVPAWRIPSTRVGQLLIVETSVLLRFLREHAADVETPAEELPPADAEERICRQLGLERTVR